MVQLYKTLHMAGRWLATVFVRRLTRVASARLYVLDLNKQWADSENESASQVCAVMCIGQNAVDLVATDGRRYTNVTEVYLEAGAQDQQHF